MMYDTDVIYKINVGKKSWGSFPWSIKKRHILYKEMI